MHEAKGEIIYYSYWLDEGAVAIAQLAHYEGQAGGKPGSWLGCISRRGTPISTVWGILTKSPPGISYQTVTKALKRRGFQNLNCSYLNGPSKGGNVNWRWTNPPTKTWFPCLP